jgi:hypothetical protein
MDVKDISAMALAMAVAGIVIAFSLLVQSQVQEETCSATGTYGAYASSGPGADGTAQNPVTGTFSGCCTTINSSNAADCDTWDLPDAFNASQEAIDGVGEFADWFTIIALAIVFAIIIGIIVRYIGGAGRI